MRSTRHYDDPVAEQQLNPESQLERDRNANDRRLKRRFEHIFEKYSRNFEGVGDEIDIGTGDIVVDNGHLERMRHEVDAGDVASSRFVQAFASSLEHEDDAEDSEEIVDSEYATSYEDEADEADDGDGDLECELESNASQDLVGDGLGPSDSAGSSRSGTPVSDCQRPVAKVLLGRGPRRSGNTLLHAGISRRRRQSSEHDNSANNALCQGFDQGKRGGRSVPTFGISGSQQLPFLKQSIQALARSPEKSGRIDSDAIQALGMSIAGQIAQFMQSASSARSGETQQQHQRKRKSIDPAWDFPEIPQRKRRRADSVESTSNEPIPSSLDDLRRSFNEDSIWAVASERRPTKKLRKMGARISHTGLTVSHSSELERSLTHSSPFGSNLNATTSTVELDYEREDEPSCANCGTTRMLYSRWAAVGRICNACSVYFEENSMGRDGTVDAQSYQHRHISDLLPQSTLWADQAFAAENANNVLQPARFFRDDIYSTPGADVRPLPYAANTARRLTPSNHIHMNGRRFTLQEDVLLLKLKHIRELQWNDIGKHFPERTVQGLQHRYYSRDLNGITHEAYKTLRAQGYRIERPTVPGLEDNHAQTDQTKDEDRMLIALRENDRLGWQTIAAVLRGRSPMWAETRYNELRSGMDLASLLAERQAVAHADVPSQVTEQVSAAHVDDLHKIDLPVAYQQYQTQTKHATNFQTEGHNIAHPRVSMQVMEQSQPATVVSSHMNNLPDIRHQHQPEKRQAADNEVCGTKEQLRGYVKYSAEEDALIAELRDKGVEWREISKHLGRSANSLSSYWHTRMKTLGRSAKKYQRRSSPAALQDENGANTVLSVDKAVEAVAGSGQRGETIDTTPVYNLRQRSRGVAPVNYYGTQADVLDSSDAGNEATAAPATNNEDEHIEEHQQVTNVSLSGAHNSTQSQHKPFVTPPESDNDNHMQYFQRPGARQDHEFDSPARRPSSYDFQLTPAKVAAAFTPTRPHRRPAHGFTAVPTHANVPRRDLPPTITAESTKDVVEVADCAARSRQPSSGERSGADKATRRQSVIPSSSNVSTTEHESAHVPKSSTRRKQHSLWSGKMASPVVTPAMKLRKSQTKRLSGSSLGSGSKRVVETPTRENADPEDDELA